MTIKANDLVPFIMELGKETAERRGMKECKEYDNQLFCYSSDDGKKVFALSDDDGITFQVNAGDEFVLFVFRKKDDEHYELIHHSSSDGKAKAVHDGIMDYLKLDAIPDHEKPRHDNAMNVIGYMKIIDLAVMLVAFSTYVLGNLSTYTGRKSIPLIFIYYEYPYQKECYCVFMTALIIFFILELIKRTYRLIHK